MEEGKAAGSIVVHKGKEIYFLNYTAKKTVDELVASIAEARQFRLNNNGKFSKGDMLILVDLTNSFVFGEGYNSLKKSGLELKPITKKRAVVGINKSKQILLNTFNLFVRTDFKAFDTVEEAKDWLVL